jgi:hypothetical protein
MEGIYIQIQLVCRKEKLAYFVEADMQIDDFLKHLESEHENLFLSGAYCASRHALLDIHQTFAYNHVVFNDLLFIF